MKNSNPPAKNTGSEKSETPVEVPTPMQKPVKTEKDNDFTRGDDQNDPANKKKIDRPQHESIHEEDEDDIQRIHEPVAEDDDGTDVLNENENETHSQDYKRNLK